MRLTLQLRRVPRPFLASVFIATGVVGRLLLVGAANIEPVLILSMLAGAILGAAYAFLVPIAILGISDAAIYALYYETTYGLEAIVGLGAFVYTGYIFVALCGGFAMRRRLLWKTRTIAVFTALSIPLTVAYDVWTAFGDWLFLGSRFGLTLADVYLLQIPFTIIHVFSSLLFAPILGTAFLAVHVFGVPWPREGPAEAADE